MNRRRSFRRLQREPHLTGRRQRLGRRQGGGPQLVSRMPVRPPLSTAADSGRYLEHLMEMEG